MSSSADLAVQAAYQEHGPALVSHLSWVTHDRALAEDLAHDAFIRLAGQIRAGRTPDNVAAWLHRVALNLAASHGRHAQVVHRRESALPRPDEPRSPESIVMGGELVEQIHALVRELSVPERHAVLLAAEGAPGSEIARAIGRTPAAARTLLCRARAKIRAGLGGAAEAVA
jgi:RNA polymerase sigma-70 factor, ECF subfamily